MISINTSTRLKRWLARAAVAFLILAGLMIAFIAFHITDIRPDSLPKETLSAETSQRARELLDQAAEKHGMSAWQRHSTLEILASDKWFGLMAHSPFNPWEISEQRLQFQFLRGTWSSRIEFLNGPEQGNVWGIQSWQPYKTNSGKQPQFENDDNIRFYLPTYQYFIEIAFRIGTASIVADIGAGTYQGKNYNRVFATWGSIEAHREHDQYIIWINQDSVLIDRIEYTVREFGGIAAGATNFADYRNIEGVMIPHLLSIRLVMPGGFEKEAHVLEIERAIWNEVDEALLLPKQELAFEGQSKN